jgi:hypothetical protein
MASVKAEAVQARYEQKQQQDETSPVRDVSYYRYYHHTHETANKQWYIT